LVLAWVLEAASGKPVAHLMSELIWSKIGAQQDAYVGVDYAGFASFNYSTCCTARDLARVGMMVVEGGVGPGGQTVVSKDWLKHIAEPSQ
jgi:CubicO group peptidase (beta-lactamase class C family)